jgi:hypothetical protein
VGPDRNSFVKVFDRLINLQIWKAAHLPQAKNPTHTPYKTLQHLDSGFPQHLMMVEYFSKSVRRCLESLSYGRAAALPEFVTIWSM